MKKSMIWYHMHCVSPLPALRNRQGAALIPIIIAIVIISTIGAVLLSLSSVGTFNSLLGNSADRAYYLAESGFRYAAMTYRHGGAGELDAINNQPFPVATNQEFSLRFRTYKLQATGTSSSPRRELYTEVAFGSAPQIPTNNAGGHAEVRGSIEAFADVNIPDPDGTEVDLIKNTGNWSNQIGTGDRVRFAALSTDATVTEGGSLQLQDGTGEEFFPGHNGRFRVPNGDVYQYKTRDNDVLLGITAVDGPMPFTLSSGDAVVLNDFVAVHSTGTYGQGYFGATRKLTYHVPFSEATSGGEFYDTFEDDNNWGEPGSGDSMEGDHTIQQQNGNDALAVTGTARFTAGPGEHEKSSLIEFDRESAGVSLASAWEQAGHFLSYDAQVKIRAVNEPVFMDGISFRLEKNFNSYGISFLKAAENGSDGIPDSIVPSGPSAPQPGEPMVVLWERNGTNLEASRWLAYHTLSLDSHIPETYFQDDMEDAQESEDKWDNYGGEWERITSASHSGNYCWRSEDFLPFQFNRRLEQESNASFDLTDASNPQLSFWHRYDIPGNNTSALVQIITDQNASWTTIESYNGDQPTWEKQTIDLSAYSGQTGVRIRFYLYRGWDLFNYDQNWWVDDVRVYERGLDWPTLIVSVKEAESLTFDNGETEITDGDTIYQEQKGNIISATVYGNPVLTSNDWGGGNASGDILLRNVTGGDFQTGDIYLDLSGNPCATIQDVNVRENYIRGYIGDTESHGSPDGNPLDRQRLENPRGQFHWPPKNPQDTNPENDYFTLVQWTTNPDIDNATLTRMGRGDEQNAVIRTNTLTSPSGNFPINPDDPDYKPEIGLHTWGWGSRNGDPDRREDPLIYLDDFGLRLEALEASGGFAPAIQESAAGE